MSNAIWTGQHAGYLQPADGAYTARIRVVVVPSLTA